MNKTEPNKPNAHASFAPMSADGLITMRRNAITVRQASPRNTAKRFGSCSVLPPISQKFTKLYRCCSKLEWMFLFPVQHALREMMQLYFSSYLEFTRKADVLTRELSLSMDEAVELLARISGYESHLRMPLGHAPAPSPTRNELIQRLLALRPDVCPMRAAEILSRMHLAEDASDPHFCTK